ncbi:MAG: ATP-dependent helicase, partial [Mycobacteriaceae bacterium]
MTDNLDFFSEATKTWFAKSFSTATSAQLGAWKSISTGAHTLVIAPTGSGKTLSAFLWAIDQLATRDTSEKLSQHKTSVLYISPLKALAVDVERNLQAPLIGITETAQQLGLSAPEITTGVRSGDTTASRRLSLRKNPPDILITTPESLFLMLTSAAADTLHSVKTVIIDEIHSVATTKRGSHLALSLERLDALLKQPAQRIGLSATVRPPEEVAKFLAGSMPVTIVNPATPKTFDLSVRVPIEDMSNIPASNVSRGKSVEEEIPSTPSIWPHVEEQLVDCILQHRSSIIFGNSRRVTERLTSRLNDIYLTRLGHTEHLETQVNPHVAGGAPAHIMGVGTSGVEPILAKAHHGSVSKEQRAAIEDDLKAGRLRCVVATSTLELGIDMGKVDLVIQVEAPPSVASGLQRIGRAGHQVGQISKGAVFPKHRTDLIHCAVIVERMKFGLIEAIKIPCNPLDVLAQQTIAACSQETLNVDSWFETVRRSASFASLPRSAYDATLDLLAGKYPSDEFAELRPRIIWDREAHTLTGRPGAGRLAITSGGTIPDRGLFPVFMVDEKASRVGELDEEMVYESRVGDVISLGATSWRIHEISFDRVLVTPAFGQPARLPFWKGDGLGRPAELGAALGAFLDEISLSSREKAENRCREMGLDTNATNNLIALISEQQSATNLVPSAQNLVVERFCDELGDWRVVLHSPYGLPVHAPWALAIAARLRERYGIEESPIAFDDGIVIRLPDTDSEPPGAELFIFDPAEIVEIVTTEIGGSALFASRFREAAARALLLPRRNPGKRAPLWQQRQKSAQLLDVARKFSEFPIILETMRECLHDVYDLEALGALLKNIEQHRIKVHTVQTSSASPFAHSLLFNYIGSCLYESDSPLAERRAAALTLDSHLLAELLGQDELHDLLDPEVIITTEQELQRLHPEWKASTQEGVADLLRLLGPLTTEEIQARTTADSGLINYWLTDLSHSKRVLQQYFSGFYWWYAIEDASRLHDGLGLAFPATIDPSFTDSVADPLGDLLSRYARTHGPFTTADITARFGLGSAVIEPLLHRLVSDKRLSNGYFLPTELAPNTGPQWCATEVLRKIRRRSLNILRNAVEPVSTSTFGKFLVSWQHLDKKLRGIDGVATVIDQLAGVPIPASAWETLILPARVNDYTPAMLDELMSTGEVLWSGNGSISRRDGWISLHPSDFAPATLPTAQEIEFTDLHRTILTTLTGGGGFFFRQLVDTISLTYKDLSLVIGNPIPTLDDNSALSALWDLVWAGHITGDTFAPVRALLQESGPLAGRSHTAHRFRARSPRIQTYSLRQAARGESPIRSSPPTGTGRWALLPEREANPTLCARTQAELLLERYGVVTRGCVVSEGLPGGFSAAYRVLSAFEDGGRCRRGYFIESLGGAQFALTATVDLLRSSTAPDLTSLALAATDPANPFGAAIPWPRYKNLNRESDDRVRHRPGRKAGALVALVDGGLVMYLERGGKTLLTFTTDSELLFQGGHSLTQLVQN